MLICIKKIVCFWCVSLVLVGGRVQAAEAYRRWRAGPTPAPSTVACSDVTASPANDLGTLRHQLHHREHQMPGHRSSDHRQTIMHAVVV